MGLDFLTEKLKPNKYVLIILPVVAQCNIRQTFKQALIYFDWERLELTKNSFFYSNKAFSYFRLVTLCIYYIIFISYYKSRLRTEYHALRFIHYIVFDTVV